MTMTAPIPIDPESLLIDGRAATEVAKGLATDYRTAHPFPHICVDDALPPAILDRVLEDLSTKTSSERSYNRAQEKKKSSYTPERLPEYTRNLLYSLNSRPFLLYLEELTGIQGLMPDPYYSGGGVHEVADGGHLDIHADFNHLGKLNLERRINVLIYLNKDWKADYGGSFEIWEKDMSAKVASFVPVFNRMVIFNTSSDSFHGNPEAVHHPDGKSRYSIALYYYTATWSDMRVAHTTVFRPRPGSDDARVDYKAKAYHGLKEVLPPVLFRLLLKASGQQPK